MYINVFVAGGGANLIDVVETLNDQTKTINLEHNKNICQIYNSNSKWNKSDREYANVNYVHVDQLSTTINYQQTFNKHDSEFQTKTEDLRNQSFVSKMLNLESKDMLQLIDDKLFLDNKNNTQRDQLFLVDDISSPLSAMPTFSSTPLHHSYANVINPHEQHLTKENRTDAHEDKRKDKKNSMKNNSDKFQAPSSYYFKPYPEIKVINQMKRPQRKGFLLPNGLLSRPVKFENKIIFVENTCGFDTIIQILHFSALDDSVYCSAIQLSTNETLQLVNAFMKKGPTNDIFLRRFLILKKFYSIAQRKETKTSLEPYFLNAENNIGTIWSELFNSEPSIFKTYECSNPTCNSEPKKISFLSVNHRMIGRDGFGALEKAIQFHSRIENIKCNETDCNGIATEISTTNFHIFIELDIKPQIQMTAGMQCTLSDFPILLHLEKKYRLAGVIGYTGGHFVAYCRRITGHWLLCNDLKTVMESCNDKTVITPHGVIYVLQ